MIKCCLSMAEIHAQSESHSKKEREEKPPKTVILFLLSICHFQWAVFSFIYLNIRFTQISHQECRIKMKRKIKKTFLWIESDFKIFQCSYMLHLPIVTHEINERHMKSYEERQKNSNKRQCWWFLLLLLLKFFCVYAITERSR